MAELLTVSERWRQEHPEAAGAWLEAFVPPGTGRESRLLEFQEATLKEIRAAHSSRSREELRALPVFLAYERYYKKFRKTYHVFLQFRSLVLEGRPFPRTPPLVRVLFLSEMRTFLLTAVHDLQQVRGPVILDSAEGGEEYEALGGGEQRLKTGDMYMRDSDGIVSSVLSGPDGRTMTTDGTTSALYASYLPQGVGFGEGEAHLDFLTEALRAYSDGLEIRSRGIVGGKTES